MDRQGMDRHARHQRARDRRARDRRARHHRARHRLVQLALAALAALVALACTGEEPEPELPPPAATEEQAPLPTPGARIAVVLPPVVEGDPALGEMERDLRALASSSGRDVEELRVVRADGPAFVGDLARRFIDRDRDLVCVFGSGGRSVAAELAVLYPARAFCAAPYPLSAESEPNLGYLEVASDELGHLVGLAAANAADGGPIGVIVDERRVGGSGFLAGLRAAVGEAPLIEAVPDDERDLAAVVDMLLAAGVEVVVIDVAGPVGEVLASPDVEVAVLTSAAIAAVTDRQSLLTWRLRWDQVLRPIVADLAAGEPPGSHRVGFAAGAFTVGIGPGFTPAQQELLAAVEAELSEGLRDPREAPPAGELPRRPDPDQDPGPGADVDADASAGPDRGPQVDAADG